MDKLLYSLAQLEITKSGTAGDRATVVADMIQGDDLLNIEKVIDRYGLEGLLKAVKSICEDKADHLEANWQDNKSASKWREQAKLVDKVKIVAVAQNLPTQDYTDFAQTCLEATDRVRALRKLAPAATQACVFIEDTLGEILDAGISRG